MCDHVEEHELPQSNQPHLFSSAVSATLSLRCPFTPHHSPFLPLPLIFTPVPTLSPCVSPFHPRSPYIPSIMLFPFRSFLPLSPLLPSSNLPAVYWWHHVGRGRRAERCHRSQTERRRVWPLEDVCSRVVAPVFLLSSSCCHTPATDVRVVSEGVRNAPFYPSKGNNPTIEGSRRMCKCRIR